MSGDDQPSRINVSRDALRAELSEMELRLRIYFDEQLRHKADAVTVSAHALILAAFDRGEFTDAQKRSIREMSESVMDDRSGRTWTGRERVLGAVAVCVAVLSLAVSAYFGARSAQDSAPPTSVEAIF